MTKNQVLLICLLNCIKANFPIEHSKVRPKVLGQSIIPISETLTSSPWAIIPRIPSLLFSKCIVELIFWSETSIKLAFELVHKIAIFPALVRIVPQSVIVYVAFLPIMRVSSIIAITFSSSLSTTSIGSIVASTT